MIEAFARLRRPGRTSALFFALTFFAVGVAPGAEFVADTDLVERVIELMDQRLALMTDVAAVKFQRQTPITDSERERDVIKQSVADAQAMHLRGAPAMRFARIELPAPCGTRDEASDCGWNVNNLGSNPCVRMNTKQRCHGFGLSMR